MTLFIWTRMQGQAGQSLEDTILRKEYERQAGCGTFWWGIGNNLLGLPEMARGTGGYLPIIFSKMLSKPAARDLNPEDVLLWTAYNDNQRCHAIPTHVVCLSRNTPRPKRYALVCRSTDAIEVGDHGPFDPSQCITLRERKPAAQQVTALLNGPIEMMQHGVYRRGFRATLVEPWLVTLAQPRSLTNAERTALLDRSLVEDWPEFTAKLRACQLG
jgi:hypothetical protein